MANNTKKKPGKYAAPAGKTKGGIFWQIVLAVLRAIVVMALSAASLYLTSGLLLTVLLNNSEPGTTTQSNPVDLAVMDRYDMQLTNTVSDALDGVLSIKKVYWLSDDDQVAPEPDQAKFGETDDPSTLQWLFDEAAELLDGQETYFTTETQIIPGTKVQYYLDETILAITWKENIDWVTYTISEVKIAHPSQFRRFLAGGEFGSSIQLTTTEMAASVTAIVASSGDFYKFRQAGVIVYDGTVQRVHGKNYDTCFVDEDGNLHFVRAGEITTKADATKFAEENNIRFSFAFGPILIDNGERCEPNVYPIGEISEEYARAGIGQKGELHYIMTAANSEHYGNVPDIHEFAAAADQFGVDKFYTLDGGQTAVIAMNDKLINKVVYGYQRRISDIIYFATAVPDGG